MTARDAADERPAGARVAVIGGGVIGLCTAYYLALRGKRVTVVDRHPSRRDGCSFGNAGMIVPSHFVPLAAPGAVGMALKWMGNPESPFYVKPRWSWELISWGWKFWRAANRRHVERCGPVLRDLHLASRQAYEELTAELGDSFGLTRAGLLMLCKTQHALEEEAATAEAARRLNIPADVLTPRQLAALEPDVRMDVAGGVHFPKDCHLTPQRFVATLEERLAAMRVEFAWEAEATGWKRSERRLAAIETNRGPVEADQFVLCGGVWSAELARSLGLKIPLQAGKGYSLTLPAPRQLPRICAILTEARVAVTPMIGALRFGGTMEMAGIDESINSRRVDGIIRSIPSYYPDFRAEDFAGVRPWHGLRPCSPDGLPYVGRTAAVDNLLVATGHAMMGLSLAPITGKIMAALLDDEPTGFDLGPLDPDRFC